MNTLQIIYYFPYLNVYLSQFLVMFLQGLSASMLSFNIPYYKDIQDEAQRSKDSLWIDRFETSNKKFRDNSRHCFFIISSVDVLTSNVIVNLSQTVTLLLQGIAL